MPEFYPPEQNPRLVQFLQQWSAPIGRWRYRITLEVDPQDVERLRSLREHRLLLLSNHPTFHDWITLFMLSARAGEAFHYMAAYERFQGWNGQFLQKLGAYSIRRGLGDRPSVVKTIELLMQPRCRLVIFPEGGCSFQNDTVMPLRTGAIQVGFQALSKLGKQGEEADLYVVPISIKYRYTGDMNRVVHRTLQVLERSLHLPVMTDGNRDRFYTRLRTVAETVMIQVETDYGLHDEAIATLDWNHRIDRIRAHILTACEQALDITPPPHQPLRERVYRIQYVLESRAEAIVRSNFWTYESIHRAAARLLNFSAIYDGYVAASPTPERYLDTLVRLEREQFNIGEPVPKGHRNAVVTIGEPLNLKDYVSLYQSDRTRTVDQLATILQQQIQSTLDTSPSLLQ
jgi:1-acyl-sn-glycerol-3-phosphate acyltransferase